LFEIASECETYNIRQPWFTESFLNDVSLIKPDEWKRHSIIRVDDPRSDGPDDEDEDDDMMDIEDDIPEDNLKANQVCLTPWKSEMNTSFEIRAHSAEWWTGFLPLAKDPIVKQTPERDSVAFNP